MIAFAFFPTAVLVFSIHRFGYSAFTSKIQPRRKELPSRHHIRAPSAGGYVRAIAFFEKDGNYLCGQR
jgi:hypothetical protein